jgi:hypothetical protein
MTLLEDLQSIDLSGIIDARASISVTVSTDDLTAIVEGGAAVSALGDFGAQLDQLRGQLDDPASLLLPLVEAATPLLDHLEVDTGALEEYAEAVIQGAEIITVLLSNLDADPDQLGSAFGQSLGEVMETAATLAEQYLPVDLEGIGELQDLVARVDGSLELDPAAFAELMLDALAPFSRAEVAQIRLQLSRVFELSGAVSIDAVLSAPLVAALDLVAAATTEAELNAALTQLESARAQVLAAIRAQFEGVAGAIAALRLDSALPSLQVVSTGLQRTEQDILEYLAAWQRDIARARETIEEADLSQAVTFVEQFLAQLEATARAQVNLIFEPAVERLKDWIRELLSHLRLRALRNQVRAFILGIAQAIRDLNLEAAAGAIRGAIASIRDTVGSADLGAAIQAALAEIEQRLTDALGGVTDALQTIGAEVNAVAGEAEAVLVRVSAVITSFQATIEGVTVAIDNLGVDEAAQQVIDQLVSVRETAEELLSVAPLPEPLRGQVEQLIELVQAIDIDAVFDPVHEALAQLEVPDAVAANVTAGLQSAQEVIENLIPAELIASIEAEVNAVLDVIRGFDPSALLAGVTEFINETADTIDEISVLEAATSVAEPFQAILDQIDELRPERLLAPVIEAYDELMGQLPAPEPATVTDRVVGSASAGAEAVTRAATEPARSLLPSAEGGGGAGGDLEVEEPTFPGDIVRLIGYVPGRLRELLMELEAGPAGEVIAAIDGFTSGLARDLRRASAEVRAIEGRLDDGLDTLLAPVSLAQSRAQLSMRANFSAGDVDLGAAMTATATVSPGALRLALAETVEAARGEARQANAAIGGAVGLALEQAADFLDQSSLGRLAGDLDALLAALDPEPIAQEIDALVVAVISMVPEALDVAGEVIQTAMLRIAALAEELNPGVQAQRFLEVFGVLQEELDLLNPRHLAADLGEVHAAIRDAVAAYDPRTFALEIDAVLDEVATALRELSPETLLGDITFLDDVVALIEGAVPTEALAGVGESLAEIGASLGEIDIAAMLDGLESLAPDIVAAFEAVIKAIQNEVIALLESLRYSSGSASASVSVSVGGGT